MDDETLQIFLEEAKEHLETIESDLLTIEEQGDHFDEDVVNKVFRAAHSLKGGAGFLGLVTIKELAHKLENVLQKVRSYELSPSSAVIGCILTGFDRLSELLNSSDDSNEMDISAQVEALDRIFSHTPQKEEMESIPSTSNNRNDPLSRFDLGEYDLKQAMKGGKTLYILSYDLVDGVQRQGKSPFDLIQSLEDSGVIVDMDVDMSAVGDLESEGKMSHFPVSVLFASIVESDLIGVLLNLSGEQVFIVPEETVAGALNIDTGVAERSTETVPARTYSQKTAAPAAFDAKKQPVQQLRSTGQSVPQGVKRAESKSESLRVSIHVLDQLMNRAGELVLARNQLLQAVGLNESQNIAAAGARIDMVTSELQEAIMLTRMQQLAIVFNKFPRVVRDLAKDLKKNIELIMVGKEVELDKTLIESLGDPLTHLVRNSLDHGIELPEIRENLGKPAKGTITLKAAYASGQVIIEIQDDGKGLDGDKIAKKALEKGFISTEELDAMSEKEKYSLILLPGFSTAEKVTDISGRGVGMDVVKTNLDKIGGQIDILSEVNRGTTIRIKLPLTLAIMPSLLVSTCNERFALPQVNVSELIRIPAAEIRQKIEKIGGADVFILREELIPLLQLNNILELQKTFYDFKTGTFRPDRRQGVVDERLLPQTSSSENSLIGNDMRPQSEAAEEQDTPERRSHKSNDAVIVVINEGSFRYGLLVDSIKDTVEIVVKPLGSFLGHLDVYAGATIMGDGHLALILDVLGMARKAELKNLADLKPPDEKKGESDNQLEGLTRQTLLVFHNGPTEFCAVPLHQVLRVELILSRDIELSAGTKVIQYRGGHLPVYALEEVANVEVLEDREKLIVIIFMVAGREVGLLAVQPLDVIKADLALDESTLKQTGISGSTIINGKTTLLVDMQGMMRAINPHWFDGQDVLTVTKQGISESNLALDSAMTVLLVEDSEFFRSQVRSFIEEGGYNVIEAEDGQIAWDYLDLHHQSVSLVVTDIEMPNMDGFELSKKIKDDGRMSHLSIIALTSLASDEDREKGGEAGIDDYQIKMDKNKLQASLQHYLSRR
ncbi:chemotaxis protein CheW [bacterium]|nr:chemotaxis protein CheW [bacterium]